MKPGYSDAYFNRGTAYWYKEDFRNAEKDFDVAIKIDPKQADAWYWRGRCKEKLGDKAGSDADIAHARALARSIDR